MDEIHYRACTLCEAICGLEIRVREGRITGIRGDDQDPFSQGHICPKGVALQDLQEDPDRLRKPLMKSGGNWQEVSWEEALDQAAGGLRRIQEAHGRDAVAAYLGNPNVHNYGNILFVPPFLKALGSRNVYSATSVDQLPHHLAALLMFGHSFLLPVPDVDRTAFFLVLGANPLVSNGSMMTAPGMRRRLKALKDRGGRLVVVDPRRTETAAFAHQHLFIQPGTDALFLAALLHELFQEGLTAPGPLAGLADGWEAVEEAVAPFSPRAVASATGIAAEEIRHLARQLAAAPGAAVYGRMGASTQSFGGLCQWLIVLLNFATGNLDSPGGSMLPLPAVPMVRGKAGSRRFDRWRSRVRNLPEHSGELPSATLADEILTPGEGQVRGLVTIAGNPVLSTPAGRRLEEALPGLEFMVSLDFYLNETSRHADVILPPTPPLEHDHYDIAFNALAVRNVARYSPALFAPPEGAKHDWQILHELRLRLLGEMPEETRRRVEKEGHYGPAGQLAFALTQGPYGGNGHGDGLTLDRLKEEPHGIDLGPLEPNLAGRLMTGDGRIHLAPEPFLQDLPRLRALLDEPAEGKSLILIGRRHVRSNNSWMHNVPRLMRGKERCTLLVNPRDAEELGLDDGGLAAVTSRAGSAEALVEVSDEMKAGVVSLPHGWGHDRPGVRLGVASEHPGTSVNDLTDAQAVDAVSGNAAVNGVPVTVRPVSP